MAISDETLMAYADGELDPVARRSVESAMREDPQIAVRIAQHQALRQRVQAAYSAELSEGVPERLLTVVRGATNAPGKIVDIRDARAASGRNQSRAQPPRPQWRTLGAIAASVMLGVAAGFLLWGRTQPPLQQTAAGALVARGQLAKALSEQLAAEPSRARSVQIGLSFLAKSGDYCRTFALSGAVMPSGLACRHGGEWQIQVLAQVPPPTGADSGYRPAGSALPPAILQAVEGQIAGDPLDTAKEQAARQQGWVHAR